jgi:hypothetical protein
MAFNPYPLDPVAFEAFLQEHAVNAVVGLSCNDGQCPLACFLNAFYPGSTFLVSLSEYRRVMDDMCLGVEPDATFVLAPWAQAFAFQVDRLADFREDVPILAGEALRVLSQVCASLPMEVS